MSKYQSVGPITRIGIVVRGPIVAFNENRFLVANSEQRTGEDKQMLTRRTNGLVILGLVSAASVALADHQHHYTCISQLAGELQQDARRVSTELRARYRASPQYWTLQSHTREIVTEAEHLQQLARSGGDPYAMRCELDSISLSFRHLVQLVRTSGNVSSPGYPGPEWRYVRGPTRNEELRRLLECLDRTIREANEELAKMHIPRSRPGHDHDRRDFNPHGPGFGPSGFASNSGSHGQTGISIGNGRLTFRFGR
jgi:hypothetical protein